MSTLQPLILWGHRTGPNSWKVALILSELNVPYEHKFLELHQMKESPYTTLNPNGRVPTIEDPNTGLVVWESGACVDYILDKYDTEAKLTPSGEKAKWTARSWRDFQISGQGPYFGQYSFFINYHPTHHPDVISRYRDEIHRIISVMDGQLSKATYLAGEEVSFVDYMWLPYFVVAFRVNGEEEWKKMFPSWGRWWEGMHGRKSVGRVWETWMDIRKEVLGR